MPIDCTNRPSGGKGNLGLFVDRNPTICAAGIPTQQPNDSITGALSHYLLQEEAVALVRDAIIPETPSKPLPPMRKPPRKDVRHKGLYTDVYDILHQNSPTKIQTVVEDVKNTSYASFWNAEVGKRRNFTPYFPNDFDIVGTTFGKKTKQEGRLYDLALMPKDPVPDKTPASKEPGYQTCRNYCNFNRDLRYGQNLGLDHSGGYMKCVMADPRHVDGLSLREIVIDIKSNYDDRHRPVLSKGLAPNNNIREVPPGFAFGKQPPGDSGFKDCFYTCEPKPDMEVFRKCMSYLNSLRRHLSQRYSSSFFYKFHLELRYYDQEKSGWLPKTLIYNQCRKRYIHFDIDQLEPLLTSWDMYDGTRMKYKSLLDILNRRTHLPDLPKLPEFPQECLDFNTTYSSAYNTIHETDENPMAGRPSGSYLFTDFPVTPGFMCKADLASFPEESDMKSCLYPSVLTRCGVSHRDMYSEREPKEVRRVFEAAGSKFTDDEFKSLWEEAQKLHPRGIVSYETFRRVVNAAELESTE